MIGGHGLAVAGVAAAGVVALGVYSTGVFAPTVLPVALPQDAAETAPKTTPEAGAEIAPDTQVAPDTTPDAEAVDVAVDVPEIAPPAFDIVRVENNGTALVAGRAVAGSEITILMDGAAVGSAEADRSGRFVSFLDLEPSEQPRILTLLMSGGSLPQEIASTQTVILAPPVVVAEDAPDSGSTQESVVVAEATAEPASEAALVTEATASAPAPTPETQPETAPEANFVANLAASLEATPPSTRPEARPESTGEAGPAPAPAIAAVSAPVPAPEKALQQVAEIETPATPAPKPADPVVVAEVTPEAEPESPDVSPDVSPVVQMAATPKAPAAPVVLLADENGVRVLQGPEPSDTAPEVMSIVALDAITYTPKGEVQIAGRGQSSRFVRVYLDNTPITTSRITDTGEWRMELPNIVTGVYTLRVDEIDTSGTVTSRIETPFKREEPAIVAQAQAAEQAATLAATLAASQTATQTPEPVEVAKTAEVVETATAAQQVAPKPDPITSVKVITVQPGSTLWAIARESYGDGRQYVRVFQANRDRIRKADLIYPGQVFTVPQDVARE